MKEYKVAVIGGGPGGYVAAIRLSQFDVETVIFEKERIGGVCLNHGCIPTKSLVKVAEVMHQFEHAADFGISVKDFSLDYTKVWERKNRIVEKLVSGVEFMIKKRKIPVINETVKTISREDDSYLISTGSEKYMAKYLILATGSTWKELPFLKTDDEIILSSRSILEMQELPKKLVVIGGGVIGCEFASLYNKMGVDVEIVEFLPNLVNTEDKEISKRLQIALKKAGIKIHLKTKVEDYEKTEDQIKLKLSGNKEITTEKVLLSVGRKPVFDIKLEKFNIIRNEDSILIDDLMKTNAENVYAIGDVTAKMMLAHTASKQALLAVDDILRSLGKAKRPEIQLAYQNIPACTFTDPEIGSAGLTEEQAKELYKEIAVGKFSFSANGKALCMSETFGLVKTVVDAKSKKLLGVHIIGPQATELIAQAVAMLGTDATLEDVQNIVFAHPTLSEAVMEALEDAEDLAIHKL